MDRYSDGDNAAFGEVYDLLAPRLFGFFMRQTNERARAEDFVQQTLMQIHSARLSFMAGSDVIPWAFAIARRLLIDARRSRKKEVLFETAEDDAAALDVRLERFSIPDDLVLTNELARLANEALSRMPEAHREAYLLIREEGLSIAQAADVLGTTPTAVKLRAHRAYEALRVALASDPSPNCNPNPDPVDENEDMEPGEQSSARPQQPQQLRRGARMQRGDSLPARHRPASR